MLWTMDMFLVKAKKDQATFWDFKQKNQEGFGRHAPILQK